MLGRDLVGSFGCKLDPAIRHDEFVMQQNRSLMTRLPYFMPRAVRECELAGHTCTQSTCHVHRNHGMQGMIRLNAASWPHVKLAHCSMAVVLQHQYILAPIIMEVY